VKAGREGFVRTRRGFSDLSNKNCPLHAPNTSSSPTVPFFSVEYGTGIGTACTRRPDGEALLDPPVEVNDGDRFVPVDPNTALFSMDITRKLTGVPQVSVPAGLNLRGRPTFFLGAACDDVCWLIN
jgi:hypothetical protein